MRTASAGEKGRGTAQSGGRGEGEERGVEGEREVAEGALESSGRA